MSFRLWILGFISLCSLATYASDNTSIQLENGLKANEALIDFLNTRQCELGFISTCSKPMSPADIKILKNHFRDLANWKRETFDEVIPENDWLKGAKFEVKRGSRFSVKSGRVTKVTLANDNMTQTELRKLSVAAASFLVMYDNFMKLTHIFSKAKKFRSIISNDMGAEGKLFYDTFASAAGEDSWKKTETLVKFIEASGKLIPQEHNAFSRFIAQSFTAAGMREGNFLFKIKTLLLVRSTLSESQFFDKLENLGGLLSKIFGNSVGKIQMRDGKLKAKAKDTAFMKNMKRKLRPLDILFEKTPFRLTDKFIPGFYGHVAIWLGTPEELINMKVNYKGSVIPLLDHPAVLPHLEKLSSGKLIVEALREPGVTMNTLEHFMDIDDLLVMRSQEVSDIGEHVLRTFQEIGKPYDFNFDVETENSIVCSELVYRVFNNETWPTQVDLGRHTISPDHVAWKAVDSCYEPTIMFHDGNEVKQDMRRTLRKLLESDSGISYTPDSHHPCQTH